MADENVLELRLIDTTPPEGPVPSSADQFKSDRTFVSPEQFAAALKAKERGGSFDPGPPKPPKRGPSPADDLEQVGAKLDRKNPLFVIAEIARRLEVGLLTAEEALDRAKRAATSNKDAFTDYMRDHKVGKDGQTPEEFFTERLKKVIDRGEAAPPRAARVKDKAETLETDQDRQSRQLRGLLQAANFGIQGGKTAQGGVSGGLALAETGMLGGKTAAFAAGPGGIIAMLAAAGIDMAVDKIAAGHRRNRELIEAGGQVAQGVVADRPMQVFNVATEQAAKSLEQIPVVGKIFAESLREKAAVVRVFGETLDAVTNRAKELAAYDPRIAQAKADQEVAGIIRDMREANQVGGQYAELIRQQTELEGSFREMMLPIKELLAKGLNDVLKDVNVIVADLIPVVTEGVRFVSATYDVAKEILDTGLQIVKYIPGIGDAAEVAEDHFREERKKRDAERAQQGQQAMEMLLAQARRRFRVPGNVGENAARDRLAMQLPLGLQFQAPVPVGGNA